MVGDDQTNKPDLRATPDPASKTGAEQKDAPLPAFIYGRNGHGDGTGRDGLRAGDRQNFNTRIADMDRKTLLGLVTGAGMLGLVLFFAGMLVGAGLFMESDTGAPDTVPEKAPVEMLATAPEEPAAISDTIPETADPAPDGQIAENSNDPVGDLIARRNAALDEAVDAAVTEAGQSEDAAANTDRAEATPDIEAADQAEPIAAPAIREVGEALTAPATPAAPVIAEKAEPEATLPAAQTPQPPKTETAKAVEPEPASKTTAPTSGDTPFSVQIGAFKVHENASQRAEELRKKGLSVAVVVRGAADDTAWYYVRIGKYATLKEARDDAAKIKKDHALDGFPVRAEPNDREVN